MEGVMVLCGGGSVGVPSGRACCKKGRWATARAASPSQETTTIATLSREAAAQKKINIPWGPCNLRVVTGHRAGLGLCLAVKGQELPIG